MLAVLKKKPAYPATPNITTSERHFGPEVTHPVWTSAQRQIRRQR